ncbi:hypothetical protein PHYC_00782 [Phycisphaerales bacterium]|nr:hypothetical protein PHYC_00782 [Phycisphaerales bacterium]
MKPRTLLIIVIVALLGVLAASWMVRRSRARAPAASADVLCPGVAAHGDQLARIVVRKNKIDTTIEKRGDAWVVASKGGFPAEREKIVTLVRAIAEATLAEAKTAKPDLYPRLQVEDPDAEGAASALLRLEDGQGKPLAALIVGKRDSAGGGPDESPRVFVRRVGEAQSYLANGDIRAEHNAIEWMNRNVGELKNERVRDVSVLASGHAPLRIHRATPDAQTFVLDGIPEGRSLRDEYVLTRLAWVLSFMTFDDVAPAADIETKVEGAGVTEFRCFDGLMITVRQVQKNAKTWCSLAASFDPPPPPPAKEGETPSPPVTEPGEELKKEIDTLNATWTPWVYQIPEFKATVLRSNMEELLKPVEPPKPPSGETPAPPTAPGG